MSERMSDERLAELRRMSPEYALIGVSSVPELIAEIDALRAELDAARTVEDGEILAAVEYLNAWATIQASVPMVREAKLTSGIAKLLTRLSAAKAEAERERDMAKAVADMRGALPDALKAQIAKTMAAERERDEARLLAEQLEANILREEKAHERTIFQRDEAEKCVSDIYFATMGEAPEWSNNFGFEDALADIKGAHKCLGDALAQARADARADALEEAAKVCDAEFDTRNANMARADAGSLEWGPNPKRSANIQGAKAVTALGLAKAIRALKGEP